ncbi:MAG: protein kinase [Clostridia bacterium]|nr:protein kinase [Clostridia bacterium]
MIGRVLSERYRIKAEIANGGMAEVYRAYDEVENREVAIKLIKKEYCEDKEYIRRFEREVNAVLSLDHPNIVRAYDFGVCDGRHYLVMELVEGNTLKDLLENRGKLRPKEAAYMVCKVLDALSCAHENGYVHRDVKPQNVLISNDNDIKLTDFGIAKSRQRVTNTFDGSKVIGSVEYISPEQVNGEPVTEKSDIYSVGIMFYEMLTGSPPFEGELAVNIAMQHIKQPVKPPHEIDPRISRALSDVVLKATAKDRNARYSSANEMKRDILRSFKQPKGRFAHTKKSERNRYDGNGEDDGNRSSKLKTGLILGAAGLVLALIAVMFFSWLKLFSGNGDKKLSKVPDLLGRSAQSAKQLLKNREFGIKVAGTMTDSEYDEGTVCKQIPAAGTAFEIGSEVEVWISSGTETVSMPNIVGKSFEDAALLLDAYGIAVESISFDASVSPEGKVLWQSIPEGTELVKGDESISIEISGSKETTLVPMPDLSKYKSTKRIADVLRIYGFEDFIFGFGESSGGSEGELTVTAQLPSAGRMVLPSNMRVEIMISPESMKAFSDIEFSIPASQTGGELSVTLLSENGEFLLYEQKLEKSSEAATIAFQAGYLEAGKFTLVVYSDEAELMRISAEFEAKNKTASNNEERVGQGA